MSQTLMQTQQLNTTSVYRRLAQLVIAIGLLILLFIKWIDANNQSRQILTANHAQLAKAQVSQSAQVASHIIEQKQSKQLTRLLNDLTLQPNITQAMVYDHQGIELARSNQAFSATTSYKQDLEPFDGFTPINQQQPNKIQYRWIVSEIRQNQKLLGYLRVSYHQQQALIQPIEQLKKVMEQVMLIGLISGVLGFLLTRAFGRFSRNSFRIDSH